MSYYTLTAIDVAAMRQADRLVVAFNDHDNSLRKTSVRLVKDARRTDKTPFATDQEHELVDCPIRVIDRFDTKGVVAFSHVSLFHTQHSPSSTIVRSLRVGDQIEFNFYPDCHTNGYVAAAGLHADVLLLYVYRGEGNKQRRLEYEIDSGISPNNTARMIRGIPESNSYRRDGARVRRENWTPPANIIAPCDDEQGGVGFIGEVHNIGNAI